MFLIAVAMRGLKLSGSWRVRKKEWMVLSLVGDSWKREIVHLRGYDKVVYYGELPGQTEEERSRPTILAAAFLACFVEMEFGLNTLNFETLLVI